MGIYRFFEIFVAPEQFLCYYMRCKFRELINAQIAQLVEQRTENPRVAGSIPALGIFFIRRKPRRIKGFRRFLMVENHLGVQKVCRNYENRIKYLTFPNTLQWMPGSVLLQ